MDSARAHYRPQNGGKVTKRTKARGPTGLANLSQDRRAFVFQAASVHAPPPNGIHIGPGPVSFQTPFETVRTTSSEFPLLQYRGMSYGEKHAGEPRYDITAAPPTEADSEASILRSNARVPFSLISSSLNCLGVGGQIRLACDGTFSRCFGALDPQEHGTLVETCHVGGPSQTPLSYRDALPPQVFQAPPPATVQPLNPYPMASTHILERDPELFAFGYDGPWDRQLLPGFTPLQPVSAQPTQPRFPLEEMYYPEPSFLPNQNPWIQNLGSGFEHYSNPYLAPTQGTLPYDPHPAVSSHLDASQMLGSPIASDKPRIRDRGPFRTTEERQDTAKTRMIGACTRCRTQHIRCELDKQNNNGACMTCKKVTSPRYSSYIVCLRGKIVEMKLFKTSAVPGSERTSRWLTEKTGSINLWASDITKTIQITEGYCAEPLSLEVRKFKPVSGDRLYVQWATKGTIKSVDIPPYAIVNIEQAEKSYKDFINARGAEFFKAALDNSGKFIRQTYDMAFYIANRPGTPMEEVKLLKDILRLWVAIRLNTRSTTVVGDETLGMPHDILDSTNPSHGKIPLPPVMSAQIELVLQALQEKLRNDVLNSLQKLVSKSPSPWFTIYICSFILLHNCALITKHDAAYAKKYGLKCRFAREAMVVEYHYGANILLDYWHRLNKGKQPFTPSLPIQDVVRSVNLDEEEKQFVEQTRRHVEAKGDHFRRIRDQGLYEDDYYFLAQLYDENWVARSTI